MVRHPAVAGQFYTGDPVRLRQELDALVIEVENKTRAIGVVAPHAGYIYSGHVAGKVYGMVHIPETVLVLGPNHYGMGAPASLFPSGEWVTPLGAVRVNDRLSELILQHAPMVVEDADSHRLEHSIEVQLPFLQHQLPHVTMVPLCLSLNDFASCQSLGAGIARAIQEYGEPVLMVASSDMTHYESAQSARKKDDLALKELTALNPQGLFDICAEKGITMCGVIPATVMLVAAKALGATSARVEAYATSGEINGDLQRVVAYAAVTVT